jgi:hypothetical protein
VKKLHSSFAELGRLVRAFEPGGRTLGPHLAEVGEALAQRMGVDPAEFAALVDLPDEQVSRHLRRIFQDRTAARAEAHGEAMERIVLAAARRLAETTAWNNDAVRLDPSVLLGDLLLDTRRTYLVFHVAGRFQTSVPRSTLVSVAQALGPNRTDLTAWVDEAGLHFRWRGGRGGVDFLPQVIPANETANLLRVNLPSPVVEVIHTAPEVIPRAPAAPKPAPCGLGWLTDVLTEIAFS